MKKTNKNIFLAISTILLINPLNTMALTKDETVYAKLNSKGSTKKIIVSEHLINEEKSNEIKDFSKLENIKNINGEEIFTNDKNNLVWQSKEKDIYYQGTSKEKLPITTKITYKLDGKTTSIKKLIGKKGHITISIDYTNNLSNKVNGKTLYTPFVVATEVNIPTKNNSNISITNGKVMSTGTNNIVVGISSPGLSKSLDLNNLNNLDNNTIEYDTNKFSKSTIYAVATSKIIDESDLNNIDTNKIYNEINQLTSATNKILDGSKELDEGSGKLVDGTNSAYDGVKQIKEAVDKSISATESDTANALTNEQVEGIKKQVLAKFTDGYIQLLQTNAKNTITNSDTYKAINQKYEAGLTTASLSNPNITDTLITECAKTSIDANYQTTCQNLSENLGTYQLISAKQLMNAMIQTAEQTAVLTAKQAAVESAEQISVQVANQVKQAATTKTVMSLKNLSTSLGQLSNGLKDLNEGSIQLSKGTKTLYNGVNEFNDSGIKKISNLVNNTLKNKIDKVKELTKLSNNYTSFSGKTSTSKGNTKFIMIIK